MFNIMNQMRNQQEPTIRIKRIIRTVRIVNGVEIVETRIFN